MLAVLLFLYRYNLRWAKEQCISVASKATYTSGMIAYWTFDIAQVYSSIFGSGTGQGITVSVSVSGKDPALSLC